MYIYISGKIGEKVISEATRQKFVKVQTMLEEQGHQVFNPTSEDWQKYLRTWMKDHEEFLKKREISEYTETLRLDLCRISECDAIYMLPDFIDSPGAKSEHAFAIACKKQVYYDDELYRDGTLRGKHYEKNRFPHNKEKQE